MVSTIQDQELNDTGWTMLNNTYPTYYRVKHNIVYVVFRLNGGATPSDGQVLGTLPERWRPALQIVVPTHNLRGNIMVNLNGEIIISANNAVSGGLNAYMGASLSYPANVMPL